MQYSRLALIAALAAPVFAQTPDLTLLSQLPACALGPATTALASNPCGTDIACACKDASFISGLTSTVKTVCSPADQQTTIEVATKLCASAGVTLDLPGAGSSSAEPSSTETVVSPSTSTTESVEPTTAKSSAPTSEEPTTTKTFINPGTISTAGPTANGTFTTAAPTSTEFTAGAAFAKATGHVVAGVMGVAGFLAFL